MRRFLLALFTSTILVSSPLFAADDTTTTTTTTPTNNMMAMPMSGNMPMSDDMSMGMHRDMPKECSNIAKACLAAGYSRHAGTGKLFWVDCMKPLLLGQSVSGVTVSNSDISSCKTFKINKMKNELKELQGNSTGT